MLQSKYSVVYLAAITLTLYSFYGAIVADKSLDTDTKVADNDNQLIFGIVTPQCFNSLVNQHNFHDTECLKFIISKLLGYAIITGSLILKLPQILKIINAKDVTGLTPTSFYMEVLLYLSSTIYNVVRGYPVSTWGENVIILVQNIILVVLLWKYSSPKVALSTQILLLTAFIVLGAAMYMTPDEYQWIIGSGSMPVAIFARSGQIFSNFQQGHTGQLAFITLVLNGGGSIARLFTTLQETSDQVMLIGFGVGAFLNITLILQVIIYWKKTNAVLSQQSMKKKE